jgi:hypothetical protein
MKIVFGLLLALVAAVPAFAQQTKVLGISTDIPLTGGSLLVQERNRQVTALSVDFTIPGWRTETRTIAQLRREPLTFYHNDGRTLTGRASMGADFNVNTGGSFSLQFRNCNGSMITRSAVLRRDANNVWRAYSGGQLVRRVRLSGPIVDRKCLNGVTLQ